MYNQQTIYNFLFLPCICLPRANGAVQHAPLPRRRHPPISGGLCRLT